MRSASTSSKYLNVEIGKLKLGTAKLKLDLVEKENRLEDLQELQTSNKSLGIDCFERPIFLGDTVKIITSSQKGPFKGENKAVVVVKPQRHACLVSIEYVEPHTLLVTTEYEDASVTK